MLMEIKENTTMEMNSFSEPDWSNKFQEYLVNDLHISKTDAIFAIGKLHSLINDSKETQRIIELEKQIKSIKKFYTDKSCSWLESSDLPEIFSFSKFDSKEFIERYRVAMNNLNHKINDICGNCEFYSMWDGGCCNPLSESFEKSIDHIYENYACELFIKNKN